MKIVAISDTHEMHRELKMPKKADLLIHAGDITWKGSLDALEGFDDWLGELPYKHKVVIAGNHDLCFDKDFKGNHVAGREVVDPEKARAILTNCIYLEDSMVEIEGIKIWGSPWQPEFCDWAFNLSRGDLLKKKWDMIPKDIGILVTHGPPYGYGDLTANTIWSLAERVGCWDLLEAIKRIKPKYHICGHIHEGYGQYQIEDTQCINASNCTRHYKTENEPVVFEF